MMNLYRVTYLKLSDGTQFSTIVEACSMVGALSEANRFKLEFDNAVKIVEIKKC